MNYSKVLAVPPIQCHLGSLSALIESLLSSNGWRVVGLCHYITKPWPILVLYIFDYQVPDPLAIEELLHRMWLAIGDIEEETSGLQNANNLLAVSAMIRIPREISSRQLPRLY